MSDFLFSVFHRDHRPLRQLLDERARTAKGRADSVPSQDFKVATDSELVQRLLEDWTRFAKPINRVGNPTSIPEPSPQSRTSDSGVRTMYWRWIFRFPMSGTRQLLEYWPKDFELEPSGDETSFEPPPNFLWQFGHSGSETVCVYLDVRMGDDREGTESPSERVVAAAKYLDEIIRCTNDELQEYQEELTQCLLEKVQHRRARLGAIAANTERTIDLVAHEAPSIDLVDLQSHATDDQVVEPPRVEIDGGEMVLDLALSDGSFRDLLTRCHRWAASAQQYPGAFGKLQEDDITSLLVTTLNVVFDTAHREVFIGKGKTDIFVEHERSDRTRAAYIGEAKIWCGRRKVADHLDQLLMRYTIERLRQVILIYYVNATNIDQIYQDAVSAFENVSNFDHWKEDTPPRVATMTHPTFRHSVDVAIVFVHIPTINGKAA